MNIPNYLKYIRINDEESELDYFVSEICKPYFEGHSEAYFKNDDLADDCEKINRPDKFIINVTGRKIIDLTGREFGKLKVRCVDTERSGGHMYYICDCECGGVKSIRADSLINGSTTSCGCNYSHNTYDLTSKEYGIGYTKNGTIFLFDKEDYDKISQYMWTNDAVDGYIRTTFIDENGNKKNIRMHRLVMEVTDPKLFVDHIHHNRADNRKSELRIVSCQENNHNMAMNSTNTSGRTGVYFDNYYGKWKAQIKVNGKPISLGLYSNKEEAIKAREEAEKRYFGEYRYQGTITTDQILNGT